MATLVSQKVDINVNVLERSVNATTNWVILLVLRIANLRGLPPDYLIEYRSVIESGLFTWLAEQKLQTISIEIFDPNREDAFERFDFAFSYRTRADLAVREPNIGQLEAFCRTLRALPAGAGYRVIVSTAPGASQVAGWYPSDFRPLRVEQEHRLSDHGFGQIGTTLVYRGGTW